MTGRYYPEIPSRCQNAILVLCSLWKLGSLAKGLHMSCDRFDVFNNGVRTSELTSFKSLEIIVTKQSSEDTSSTIKASLAKMLWRLVQHASKYDEVLCTLK